MTRRVLAAAAAVLVLAACGHDEPAAPAATLQGPPPPAAAPPPPTTSPPVTAAPLTPEEDEVVRAYLRSWDVMARAYRDLDPSVLDEAFDGKALDLKISDIERQIAINEPRALRLEHAVTAVDWYPPDGAVVRADISNHSVALDPVTLEPIESDPNETWRRDFGIQHTEDEGWQVIFIATPD